MDDREERRGSGQDPFLLATAAMEQSLIPVWRDGLCGIRHATAVPALAGAAAPARDAVSLPKKKPTGAGRPILLVLRARGLGDFLTAIPAYRALAENFPRHPCLLPAPAALPSL